MEPVVAIVFVFSSISFIWGSYIYTRHRERMTMIDKGLKAEDIRAFYERSIVQGQGLASLKWGIVCVALGVALLTGQALHAWYDMDEGAIIGIMAVLGGLGLILFYVIARRRASAA